MRRLREALHLLVGLGFLAWMIVLPVRSCVGY